MISFFLGGYDILVNWDAEYKGKVMLENGIEDIFVPCFINMNL